MSCDISMPNKVYTEKNPGNGVVTCDCSIVVLVIVVFTDVVIVIVVFTVFMEVDVIVVVVVTVKDDVIIVFTHLQKDQNIVDTLRSRT